MDKFRIKIFVTLLGLLLGTQVVFAQFADQRNWSPSASTGTANAQTIALANYALTNGVVVRFLPGFPNTGATTVNVNTTGVKNLFKPSPAGPTALVGGELQAGQVAEIVYDGTEFVVVSSIDSTATSIFPSPQGYLTPCPVSGTPVATPATGCTAPGLTPTGDVTAATTLFYEPTYGGNQVPIYNGSRFVVFSFTESQMTLVLGSTNLANTIYDVCVWNNAGVPAIGTTVAWTTSTPGSGSRGTGAGTAQIARVNGVWTNAVAATVKNGGSTNSVPANQCTIVATLLTSGTNGQTNFHRTTGQSRMWGVSNFYNRLPIYLKVSDPTGTPWSYTSATPRASNGNTANSLTALSALPEEPYLFAFSQKVTGQIVATQTSTQTVGIGYNSTSVMSGFVGSFTLLSSSVAFGNSTTITGKYVAPPALGAQTITSLEATTATANVDIYSGTESSMLLEAWWRG